MESTFYFTDHALIEMDNDELEIEDVMRIAEFGILVEDYPTDRPYPSTLKLGQATGPNKYSIHVVSAVSPQNRIHVITAYIPDPLKWDDTFMKRNK